MRVLFWIFLLLLIVIRLVSSRPEYDDGTKIRINDRVSSEPLISGGLQRFRLSGIKINFALYPEIHYGDQIVVEGVVSNGELQNPKVITIDKDNLFLYQFRRKVISFYQQNLPQPDAGLIEGITLGGKSGLSYDFYQKLKSTGTTHVVVASGMNVTIVAKFLLAILLPIIKRGKALILTLIGIWTYSLLSGFEAPIIRAGIMATIALGSQGVGRLSQTSRALFLAGAFMLIAKPVWITDLGFILSFISTASILVFEARIRKKLFFLPRFFKEGLSTSWAAQIGVAPILWLTFGKFNIFSPLINALVIWTIAPIMIISAIGGVVGVFTGLPGKLILILSIPLTRWFISIIDIFS